MPTILGLTELSRWEDKSGVSATLTTTPTQLFGSVLPVPPTTLPVWLEMAASFQITAAGAGGLIVAPYETTTGAGVATYPGILVAGSFLAGTWSKYPNGYNKVCIGSSPTWRNFALYGYVVQDTSSTLAAQVRSSTSQAFLTLRATY